MVLSILSRFRLVFAAGCVLAITTACSHCGGDAVVPADDASIPPKDARSERSNPTDANEHEAGPADGSTSDWTGWRRLVEFDPQCVVDVPVDVTTALPPIKWIPCTNLLSSCQQIDTSTGWRTDNDTNFVSDAKVNATGNRITIARLVTLTIAEFDVYSFPEFAPIAAWRSFGGSGCNVKAFGAPNTLALFATDSAGRYATASGVPPSVVNSPAFDVLQPTFNLATDILQTFGASDKTLAFDLAPAGQIVRQSAGSSSYVRTKGETLFVPLVSGNDVYAWQEYGPAGWSREFRVDPDGSTTVFREVPQHKVGAMTTDGATIWWIEAYGLSDPTNLIQPTTDVFSAPYTSDPVTLGSTASKVGSLSNARFSMLSATFNGILAYTTNTTTYLIRKSDAKTRQVSQGTGQFATVPIYVSDTDWYAVQTSWGNGPHVTSLTKTQLSSW